MTFSLEDKRAVVCGSTQGIGRSIAEKFAEMGAEVVLIARNQDKLKEVKQGLPSINQRHDIIQADFSDPDNLREKIRSYFSSNPGAHILVNNTGGPPAGSITNASSEEFLKAYQMHLVCNHILVTETLPFMKEKGYGRIINVISTSVKQPIDGLGVSNTTRGAVASWAKTLSNEVSRYNITVNNLLPGFINTQRLKSLFTKRANDQGISYESVLENAIKSVPMGRIGEPSEMADAAAFLASPAASYISGINLPVDGGRTKSL